MGPPSIDVPAKNWPAKLSPGPNTRPGQPVYPWSARILSIRARWAASQSSRVAAALARAGAEFRSPAGPAPPDVRRHGRRQATLRGAREALRPGGQLVFETRVTARRAWEHCTRERSHGVTEFPRRRSGGDMGAGHRGDRAPGRLPQDLPVRGGRADTHLRLDTALPGTGGDRGGPAGNGLRRGRHPRRARPPRPGVRVRRGAALPPQPSPRAARSASIRFSITLSGSTAYSLSSSASWSAVPSGSPRAASSAASCP